MNEISPIQSDDPSLSKTHLRIFIRATNAKTGRSRVVVAPIKNRVEKIRACYESLGVPHGPTDYLFFNPHSADRKAYTRESLFRRLTQVLK